MTVSCNDLFLIIMVDYQSYTKHTSLTQKILVAGLVSYMEYFALNFLIKKPKL